MGEDLSRLFNQLSGYAPKSTFKRLLVAPRSVRSGLIDRIETEIRNARAGLAARVQIKVNSMVDEAIIDSLYRASQAGVPVDIIVRGICSLRPGVPGLSENITVRSVLGRFLEHSRVFAFANGGDPVVYIGSADMMHRNLDRRVEALVQLTSGDDTSYVMDLLRRYMDPDTASWHLDNQGEWTRHHLAEDGQSLAGHPVLAAQFPLAAALVRAAVGALALSSDSLVADQTDHPGEEIAVVAAGAVPWRVTAGDKDLEVLLIHRPRYDDWSWPKGKIDPGETVPECAAREVDEEIGLKAPLGIPLPSIHYHVPAGLKVVHYWAVDVDGAALLPDGKEVDSVMWCSPEKAARLLSNPSDVGPLEHLAAAHARGELKTWPLVIVRHAKAKPRSSWSKAEGDRPLAATGLRQAQAVGRLLQAWKPMRVVSSPWLRCVATIAPYAKASDAKVKLNEALTEHRHGRHPHKTAAAVEGLFDKQRAVALCTHRPALPTVFAQLGKAHGIPVAGPAAGLRSVPGSRRDRGVPRGAPQQGQSGRGGAVPALRRLRSLTLHGPGRSLYQTLDTLPQNLWGIYAGPVRPAAAAVAGSAPRRRRCLRGVALGDLGAATREPRRRRCRSTRCGWASSAGWRAPSRGR